MGGISNGPTLDHRGPLTAKSGVEKSPFQISTNRLEVDENVNRTPFKIHWLVVKGCNEQSYIFRQSST